MTSLSRRKFLGTAAGVAALVGTRGAAQTSRRALVLKVQYTTGSHTVPLTQYEMFDDELFRDLDTWIVPFPHPFTKINEPGGPDVVVLGDWLNAGWPESDREPMTKYLDSGKGLVLLHHGVATNEQWSWWANEVSGCILLFNPEAPGKRTPARLKQFPKQTLSPVGDHPIVRDMKPFQLPWDEIYPNMKLSPKITPLVNSDDPDRIVPTVGWIGPHPKARVVALEPGHTDQVNADPRYRHLVHNMILWAGRKLS